ncbi:hypothetical protein [Natrinema ejinorense]|uniref:Uncharacterized protein n=1 Tax=Natrinema ejinorense TaxID=373386 RepID=A0A2A5QPF3_9EURY|nr:hypothetical protein [Natrinema ejinorense]PCR88613.1 hypothetical protein CP557_21500 [Natrinema ejinorense]
MTKDVLIYSSRDDVEHKLAENVPDHHDYAFWTVSGTPRQTGPGASVLFTDGDRVYARGRIIECAEGELRFEPLEHVNEPLPCESVAYQGFKYVEPSA